MSNLNLGPKSLFAPTEFLSSEQCQAIFDRVVSFAKGGGDTTISVHSQYTSGATWVQNRVYLTRAVTGLVIDVRRNIRGARGLFSTTRMDDEGLREAVRQSEESAYWTAQVPEDLNYPKRKEDTLKPVIWSDPTYAVTGAQRGDLAQRMIAPAEAAGLLAAGELLISGEGQAVIDTQGVFRYYPYTRVACSMTVRDAKGTASGWAGQTHHDLGRIDPLALAARAVQKCVSSANPVRIEPGFYTTILEPQAVADLLNPMVSGTYMSRIGAEIDPGPFHHAPGRSKIGYRVIDRRLTMRSDAMEPDGGFVPFDGVLGDPYLPVTWMDQGYLRELAYLRRYALSRLNKQQPLSLEGSYKLSSNEPAMTVEDMIKSTQRGILVTRLHDVSLIDMPSMLCGGYTRDGMWLIQNGKITNPLKNFRFTESPLFALNKVEAVGAPVRVFDQRHARLVPPIKIRDFSFTSLADAV